MTSTAIVPLTADEAFHVGTLVHSSGLFGDISKAEQAAVKVMAGAELGIGPIASTRGVDIIKGEVSLSAGLCAALVKRSEKYDYKIARWDDEGCEIVFYEHGQALNPPITFNHSDAVRAKLAGGDNYQKYPRAMYFARAMTIGARAHCPDLFAGSVYTAEELGAPVDSEIVELPMDVAQPGPAAAPPPTPAPAPKPPEPVSAPPADSPTLEQRLAETPAEQDNGDAPEITGTPAEIMARLGMPEATQAFMLVSVGVEDVGDLAKAYAGLSDEQVTKVIEMARARAGAG